MKKYYKTYYTIGKGELEQKLELVECYEVENDEWELVDRKIISGSIHGLRDEYLSCNTEPWESTYYGIKITEEEYTKLVNYKK